MTDPRIKRVAEILVNYSLRIKKGEYVGISAQTSAAPLIKELYEIILKKGAYPVGDFTIPGLAYTYFKNASDEQLSKTPEISKYAAEKCHASISIGADANTKELSTINPDRISIRSKAIKPIKDIILKKDRWVLFKYPTDALAQDAEMSLQEFEDFVYTACIKDWEKETKKLLPLKQAMDRGSTVRIKGEDTDISFSIKARTAVIGDGKHNIPDGEVFTAPVEKTVNGRIKFTFPAIRDSREVSGVYLEFRNGKVTKAKADKNESYLKSMIKMDKGSQYLGELGIGTNYNIKKFIKQILFDEKIGGTIHLALGKAYKECGGTNESALHWDIIKDLRQGGELYIDNKLIQKNGKFLI